jgi:hypothetical protein
MLRRQPVMLRWQPVMLRWQAMQPRPRMLASAGALAHPDCA